MKIPRKTASFASYAWTILLIIILGAFTSVTILSNFKSETIKKNIQALNQENYNYHKIDTCISLLYVAENNSRLFVVTLDSTYLKAYKQQLQTVSSIITKVEQDKRKEASSLSSLIKNKQISNEQFFNLKLMLDSLLSVAKFQTILTTASLKKPVSIISTNSNSESTDSVITPGRKRLFKRIADAIINKQDNKTAESRLESSTSIMNDSIQIQKSLDKINSSNISETFNLTRYKLNKAEQKLLVVNARIFAKIQSTLAKMKAKEEENAKVLKNTIISATSAKFEDIHHLSWGNILIVLTLVIIIIHSLIKLYRKENTILEYANLTAETSKKKAAFMAQLAHEIRTPLNSIIGFSQLIDSHQPDENLSMNINAIKSSSKILLTLVNEILDFSKFESGNITLLNKTFYPAELLNEAIAILSILASEKQISLLTQFNTENKMMLIGDEFRIKQIAINLITNAIKFTPKGGQIIIGSSFEKTGEEKGVFKFNVKDSGIGIAKEHLETIFDEFIQIETADSVSRHMGTGLGLAICKRIVDLYSGDITVESIVGKGSEFKVKIPLKISKIASDEDKKMTVNLADQVTLAGKKLLIVDDIRINLLLLSKIMDKNGATYDLAADGQKAYELFEKNFYDLIITDIHMPVMDGVELTKLIRKYPDINKAKLPILAFTGSSTEEHKIQYTSIGMNDVLEKPFEESHLIAVLNKLLNETEIHKE